MRVLVVGANGFLGDRIASSLVAQGDEVRGTVRGTTGASALDLTDVESCRRAIIDFAPTVVINAAGAGVTPGRADTTVMTAVNVSGALNLARACAERPRQPHLVHLASSTEPRLGSDPESRYSASKALGTSAVRELAADTGTPISIARIHNVYGASQPPGRFIADLVTASSASTSYEIHHPERVRDFCLVDDAVAHIVRVAEMDVPGEFEIGTGIGTRLREAAHLIAGRFGDPGAPVALFCEDLVDAAAVCVAGDGPEVFLRCPTHLDAGLEQMAREMAA